MTKSDGCLAETTPPPLLQNVILIGQLHAVHQIEFREETLGWKYL